ncbi:MAG: UDP-N-acetylglucosamine 2-epimerase (non-hydrolyzing) [Candidatus Heimdallarchaeota archaeon]|nr:UDP-N-acetylglucosamine 2-epimerase (non-hydrolyzing) [Candidatus Heimdallarchaeota archaeon]
MTRIMVIFGTRAEITKIAPIIRRIEEKKLELILIHSGQHYDYQMSNIFLKELNLTEINENLEIGSGSHGYQTSEMLKKYENVIHKYNPDIVTALGDTNSVVAASIICAKLNLPFGHIEAGIRSYDLTMPEEVNRKIADSISSLYFAPSKQAILNLYYEGIDPNKIFLTGNTAIDATLEHAQIAREKSQVLTKLNLDKKKPIITLTTHRAGNVDNKENLANICLALSKLDNYNIVFPVHPRTEKQLEKFGLKSKLEKLKHLILIEPLGYLDFLNLMQHSDIILTDSGGLQEEAITLKIPCVTLRTNTERPETIKLGVNFLVGTDCEKIVETINLVYNNKEFVKIFDKIINPYGDGRASYKIVEIIQQKIAKENVAFIEPKLFQRGSLEYKLLNLNKTMSVKAIENEYKATVTLVYDQDGKPRIIPKEIPKGWIVRIQY